MACRVAGGQYPASLHTCLQPQLNPFAEHLLNFLFEDLMLRRDQRRIGFDHCFCRGTRFFENIRVPNQITEIQLRQSMLPRTEDFTGTAQILIIFGNHKAILGSA